jgi:transglutaminase-like putative cysteine protease
MTTRRQFLLSGAAGLAATTLAPEVLAQQAGAAKPAFAPKPGSWRSYEVQTEVSLTETAGARQAWLPVPAFADAAWVKPGATTFRTSSGKAAIVADPKSGAQMLHVIWDAGDKAPTVQLTSSFSATDRRIDLATQTGARLADADRKRYLAGSALAPTDGIVRDTALKIVGDANSDVAKVHRIYDWIVDNTFRQAKTRGCGTGDIVGMLKTGNLSGKCADLNALFVGLVRAAGIPARDLYGIRVAPSAFGYKSLGANSATITKAQHCRAEVFIDNIGWLPMDPADVRKVMLEEPPGNLTLANAEVAAARQTLFGAWESNWLPYNSAHDIALPGSSGPSLPFLMYPQAETASGRLDCLEPDTFRYAITARELKV